MNATTEQTVDKWCQALCHKPHPFLATGVQATWQRVTVQLQAATTTSEVWPKLQSLKQSSRESMSASLSMVM